MTHPLLSTLAVILIPPTAILTITQAGRHAVRAVRSAVRRLDRWRFIRGADATWRAAERAEQAERAAIHARVMAGYWHAMLPEMLLMPPIGGDPRGALLAAQWAVGQHIADVADVAAQRETTPTSSPQPNERTV